MYGGIVANRDCEHRSGNAIVARMFAQYLSIDPREALFARRGFPSTPAQPLLESVGAAFISGYNFAVAGAEPAAVLRYVSARTPGERGFVAEGAAMAAAVRAALIPWTNALRILLKALSPAYVYLAHVGVGWAIARLPFARSRLLRQLEPRLAPLAIDGCGFHDGYFFGPKACERRRPRGDWGPVYDQGVGRSLWFYCGADPAKLAAVLRTQSFGRLDDLWAGIGLACVYAGGADDAGVKELVANSGDSRRWLRQGAAFAVAAHARAGVIPERSATAAAQICGVDPHTLVRVVDDAFVGSAGGREPQSYHNWQRATANTLERRGIS